jgi:hypothetical protein
MKRKLFTLLFALVALASFQVNASGPWWIKADTTGLSGNLSYGGNKVSPLQNWFVWAANDAAKINAENSTLFTDGLDSRFEVTQVGSNDRLINIKSLKSGSQKISLTYGANAWTQFEVVQFDYTTITTTPPYMGGARTTQALTSSGLEGYLMPAQGGLATLQDTTSSMLMVVSDKNGAFSIKRVDEVFTFVDSPDSITVPRVVPINWDASEFQGVSFGATDTLSYVSTYTNLVPYQSVEWGRIGLYKWAGIKQTGNQHPINMKIAGGKPIVYMTIGPGSPGWAAFTTKPELIYENPQWLTAYVGVDPAASGFSSEVTLAANWTNGLPYDFVTGSQSVNASSGGAYVIFRVDGTAKIKNGQVVSNPFVTVNGVDYPTIPGGPSVYDKVLASGGYTTNATLNKWRPVYIKLEKPAGRWATPDDFPCTYTTFPGLYVINSKLTAPYFTTDTIRTFVVKQVDWVAKTSGKQSDQNIFGNSGDGNHYVPKFDEVAVGGAIGGRDVGLQKVITLPAPAASGADSIIPLFTLSSPEVDCGVVSVSRQNDLDIQSQGIGVYANKLEIRDYGYYYDYKKNANGTYTYEKHQASSVHDWDWSHSGVDASGLDEDRVATSLQKFAFWIDIDGNYTMYPAASYSWEYGKTKEEEQSIVKPNSVLLYNNTEIALTTGGVEGLDKSWGVEIGTWNGRTTANPGVNSAIISTIPNVVITGNSDYTEITYNPTCNTEGIENLKGRFYFLDVLNPGVNPGTTGYFYNATRPNAIQDSTRTQYVLSTEVVSGVKQLIIIPKEKVRAYADGNGNKWYDALEA